MAKVSPTRMRGLLIHDPRIVPANIDATDSSYTEASPRPGVPEAQGDTEMVLRASGTQSGTGALRIQAHRAGYAERDGAGFVWQQSGDAAWRGWESPNVVTALEALEVPTVATEEYRHPHAVTLESGAVLVVTCQNTSGTNTIDLHKRNTAGTWAASEIATESNQSTLEAFPCLVVLPSGRVLCFYAVYDTTSNLGQVRCYYSDDDGATWAVYQRYCLRDEIDTSTYTPKRIRAAYNDGQILLVMERSGGTRLGLVQYASDDLGASFITVSTQAATSPTSSATTANARLSGTAHDVIAVPGGGFLLMYQPDWTAAQPTPYWHPVPSAFRDLWGDWPDIVQVDVLSFGAANYQYTECALTVADDGAIVGYILAVPLTGSDSPAGECIVSWDSGASFTRIGQDIGGATSAEWFKADGGAAYPLEIAATWQRGRALILANHAKNGGSGSDEDSLWAWYLGGYSTVTLPASDRVDVYENMMSWAVTWAPAETPTDAGWSSTGTAATESITGGDWRITTTNGNSYIVHKAPALSPTTGAIAEVSCKVDGGYVELLIIATDGTTEDHKASVRLSTTTADVYDYYKSGGAGTVGSTLAISSGTWTTMRIGVGNGKVYAAVRASTTTEDREWTVLANGVTIGDGGGAEAADRITFGRTFTIGASDFSARHLAYGGSNTFADNIADGQTNPDDIRPRFLSADPIYVDDGVEVAAVDGPCATGDTWHIDARHDYPIEHLHPLSYPSPQMEWRSTTVGTEYIAWQLEADDGAYLGHDIWGMHLIGINCPDVRVQYEATPGGGWSTIGIFDLRSSFAGQRKGTAIRPAQTGSTVTGPYIEANELVGGYVEFPNGDVRQIIRNTPGTLTSGSTIAEHRCTIYLDADQADDGEDASGTFSVWPPNATLVMHRPTDGNALSGLRVYLNGDGTTAAPPEGYWRIGQLIAGPIAVLGWDYSWTRRIRVNPNVDVQTSASGMRMSHVLGPHRSAVELAWVEGVDISEVRGTQQDDYVVSTATAGQEPVASRHDAPLLVRGLLEEHDGPHVPLVYLPLIDAGTPDEVAYTYQRAGGAIYGRMVGGLSLETILGEEEIDEVVRASVTIEQEV